MVKLAKQDPNMNAIKAIMCPNQKDHQNWNHYWQVRKLDLSNQLLPPRRKTRGNGNKWWLSQGAWGKKRRLWDCWERAIDWLWTRSWLVLRLHAWNYMDQDKIWVIFDRFWFKIYLKFVSICKQNSKKSLKVKFKNL